MVGHWDVKKDLTNPEDPYGEAAAAAYKYWIKSNSIVYPNIVLESQHSYFSRRASSNWYVVLYAINPKALSGPISNFKTEETSEYKLGKKVFGGDTGIDADYYDDNNEKYINEN